MCQNYNTLPRAGGLLDQDSLMMHIMFNIAEFDGQRAELEQAKAKQRGA